MSRLKGYSTGIGSFDGITNEQRKEIDRGKRRQAKIKGINPRLVPHVILHGVEHKSCSACGSLKPLDSFHNNSSKPDGKQSYCSDCDKQYKESRKS